MSQHNRIPFTKNPGSVNEYRLRGTHKSQSSIQPRRGFMQRLILFSLLAFTLSYHSALAQDQPSIKYPPTHSAITTKQTVHTNSNKKYVRITGIVKAADDNLALPLTMIKLKDTKRGSMTNEAGYFSIDVPRALYKSPTPPVLEFTYLGYEKVELQLNNPAITRYTIILPVSGSNEANDVTVIAGKPKRKGLWHSIKSIFKRKNKKN